MTLLETTTRPVATRPVATVTGHGRFVFHDADWHLYEQLDQTAGPGVRVTFNKGELEIVTLPPLHDATSRALFTIIAVLSEELDIPRRSVGSATFRLETRDVGLQGDEAFYFGDNVKRIQARMDAGTLADLTVDPPPDLAIEVEITCGLGQRIDIYREIGVREVWRFDGALRVLVLNGGEYEKAERSPTFPLLSPQELAGFVAGGVRADETAFAKQFRRRVIEAMAKA